MVNILFLCDRNTVRSPMASALVPGSHSAGISPDETVDPFAVAVMAEDGLDLSTHTPRAADPATFTPDTLVIALSEGAFVQAREWRKTADFELDYWALPAPPGMDDGREAILDGYRAVREALKAHIRNRFANR